MPAANPQPTPNPRHDVRMRGFDRRCTVEKARDWLDAQLAPLDSEQVGLAIASGRVLSQPIVSPVDVPAFERAMMDGYAVRADDTSGASSYNPRPLNTVGLSLPGRAFAGSVGPGQAARIMTGAPLPPGANAVLPAELAEATGQSVNAVGEVSPGKHVGHCGEDVATGATVLPAGRRLRPQDLGLLSSIGCSEVMVVRRPRVALVITGDELLPAGSTPRAHQIADANGPMLTALAQRDGAVVSVASLTPDDPQAIRQAMEADADVIVVSGGSSVGQEDHAPLILAAHGELAIHGIAMRPSSPAGMGKLGQRLVFLAPGNPVSCLCAYDFFAGRAIRVLGGRSAQWPYPSVRATLARKLTSAVGRLDYARVRWSQGNVEPLAIGGASVLSSTTRADGFVLVPADSEGYPAGAEIEVWLYDLVG